MIRKELCPIVSQKEIAEGIFELTVKAELAREIMSPGQFVHLKINEGNDPLLRRPISIAAVNHHENLLTMIYRREGRGTSLLSSKGVNEVIDILGPLGNGFPVHEAPSNSTALLVGGGIGVPPLYELSRKLKENGVRVIHVLGFETAGAVFYEKEFAMLGETYITTVDGTYGTKGFVTDAIRQKKIDFDILYSCGPTPMLKALEQSFPEKKVYLSLEERMGCGIGACFACVCRTADDPTGYSYRKVCSDGPVFRAGEVML